MSIVSTDMTLKIVVPIYTDSKQLIIALENNLWGSLHTCLLLKEKQAAT